MSGALSLGPGKSYTQYATFHNVPWPGTSVSIKWGNLGQSAYIYPFGSNDTDWANSSFCSRSWPNAPNGVNVMGANYKGVAACGDPYGKGNSNNHQGWVRLFWGDGV